MQGALTSPPAAGASSPRSRAPCVSRCSSPAPPELLPSGRLQPCRNRFPVPFSLFPRKQTGERSWTVGLEPWGGGKILCRASAFLCRFLCASRASARELQPLFLLPSLCFLSGGAILALPFAWTHTRVPMFACGLHTWFPTPRLRAALSA